ncbi:DUF7519 family protein [Natrarchaeobaculum sulfurireducens]|uniref:Uncharacterized protein n=1 Tax=Natrarchaeobaculum sulfurireducens TaxID=2044521 RepID=A0A346PLQ5_9EURY|nr:hypothetical protein [Natrarchaeobaculum sulfurireducens]AXR80450.1 hypothetical protein AArcMg_0427 [Natrarchaeobaculum sulfurireducens]
MTRSPTVDRPETSSSERALDGVRRFPARVLRSVRAALERATVSEVVAIGLALSIGITIGTVLVGSQVAVLASVAGLAAAGAIVLLASEQAVVRGVGGVLAVPVSLLVLAPTVLVADLVRVGGVGRYAGVTVWALLVAAFAAGLFVWERFGDGGVRRGATGTVVAAVGVVGVALFRLVPESAARERAGVAAADAAGWLWNAVVVADGPWALGSFAVLLFATAVGLRTSLNYVALERFMPPDRRASVSAALDGLERGCDVAVRLAVVIGLAAVVVPTLADQVESTLLTPGDLAAVVPAPLGEGLAALITASSLRLVLCLVLGLAVGFAGLEWLRRALRRDAARVFATLVAPALGGGVVAVALAWALAEPVLAADPAAGLDGVAPASVVALAGAVPPFALAAGVLAVGLVSLASLSFAVVGLRTFRIVPRRAIGAALAAGAILLLAAGLAVVSRVELAIATAAGAFVVWDVGEYGDGMRRDLGAGSTTVRAEFVHLGGSLLSGLVIAGGTIALYRWTAVDAPVTDPAYAALAVVTGLLAVVLVAWALRG